MRYTLLAVLFSATVTVCASAQNPPPVPVAPGATLSSQAQQDAAFSACIKAARFTPALSYCKQIAYFLQPVNAAQRESIGAVALTRPASNPAALAEAIALYSTLAQVVTDVNYEAQRLDKQIGSPSSTSAATNLVSKPGATQLLAVAVESGALTQTQSGNTITLQGNLDQLVRFVSGTPNSLQYTTKGTPVLQNISLSSTLSTNASSTSSIPVSGSAGAGTLPATTATAPSTATKLSSIGARYQFHNKFDPKSEQFEQAYIAALGTLDPATPAAAALLAYFDNIPLNTCGNPSPVVTVPEAVHALNVCLGNTIQAAETANNVALKDIADKAAALAAVLAKNANTYRQAVQTASGTPVTVEYVYNRPENQPDTHDLRGVVAWTAGAGILNANVAASIYGTKRPADATYGRFKDVQIAAEFDRAFSPNAKSTSPSFSIAAYGQYQSSPSVLTITASSIPAGITLPPDGQTFISGTQGWLAVVQGKVIFKIAGAQIPVGAKWSNKTDLLDKGSFGAQFGISYDLSQIKQLIGLGATP